MSTVTGFHLEQGRPNHIYQNRHFDGCPLASNFVGQVGAASNTTIWVWRWSIVRRKGPDPFLQSCSLTEISGALKAPARHCHPARLGVPAL